MNELEYATKDMDAGRRLVDAVNLHLIAHTDVMDIVGRWCAFHLETGESDGRAYGSKDEAIRYTKNPERYCYFKITPDGIRLSDAIRFLRIHRHPLINVLAPERIHYPQVFPQFSNLTKSQRKQIRKYERNLRNAERT